MQKLMCNVEVPDRILSISETIALTTYSRASIYRLMKAGTFPKAVKLGQSKIGFWQSEVYDWLARCARV